MAHSSLRSTPVHVQFRSTAVLRFLPATSQEAWSTSTISPVHSPLLSTVILVHVLFQSTLQSSPLQYTFHGHGTLQSTFPSMIYSSQHLIPVHGVHFIAYSSLLSTSINGSLQSVVHHCPRSTPVHNPLQSLVHASPLVYFSPPFMARGSFQYC